MVKHTWDSVHIPVQSMYIGTFLEGNRMGGKEQVVRKGQSQMVYLGL